MGRGKPQKKGRQGRPDVEQPSAPAKGGTVGCFVSVQVVTVHHGGEDMAAGEAGDWSHECTIRRQKLNRMCGSGL